MQGCCMTYKFYECVRESLRLWEIFLKRLLRELFLLLSPYSCVCETLITRDLISIKHASTVSAPTSMGSLSKHHSRVFRSCLLANQTFVHASTLRQNEQFLNLGRALMRVQRPPFTITDTSSVRWWSHESNGFVSRCLSRILKGPCCF